MSELKNLQDYAAQVSTMDHEFNRVIGKLKPHDQYELMIDYLSFRLELMRGLINIAHHHQVFGEAQESQLQQLEEEIIKIFAAMCERAGRYGHLTDGELAALAVYGDGLNEAAQAGASA